jgi:5-methyltetrahydropteroyltriglutamate--homocysteine methyltransferase
MAATAGCGTGCERFVVKLSADRILTTHCGSLPRPASLLDLMSERSANPAGEDTYSDAVRSAVDEVVRLQVANGIDVVTDGEQSKPGFFTYVTERLTGFEVRPELKTAIWSAELEDFPEYYADYFERAMIGSAVARPVPLVCVGPVLYRGQDAVSRDIANLKDALDGRDVEEAFMAAVAPSGPGSLAPSPDLANEFYLSYQDYLFAVADALHEEYQAIVDAGLLLQVDDPFLADVFSDPALTHSEKLERADLYVEATNRALTGIPAERVRFHTCYGINEGPRIHDPALKELLPHVLKINACGLSFEAANARHEHEYHVFESVKLPDDRVLIPGVITHASNIVEHPELIAERLLRFARLVGRDRVIASSDCGFSSQATYKPEVDPKVMWAKFAAMRAGADLATKSLWN